MCMAKPLSGELVIEWGQADARPKLFPPRENMPFLVVDKLRRTPRIVELRLRPLGSAMRYWPGQYVLLGDFDARVAARSYSLASAPKPDGEIVLQISRVDGGGTSGWVHDDVEPGDMLKISGPYGTFVGDPTVETPVLCLAAGSGLAPILSLAEAALRRGFALPVTLLFSAREPSHVYSRPASLFGSASTGTSTSCPRSRARAPGNLYGRIPAVLPGLFPDLARHSVFVAGSPGFVSDCVSAATSLGARTP